MLRCGIDPGQVSDAVAAKLHCNSRGMRPGGRTSHRIRDMGQGVDATRNGVPTLFTSWYLAMNRSVMLFTVARTFPGSS